TLRGGKRLRASLVEIGYLLFQRSNEIPDSIGKIILQIGGAMELLQSFFLIHDDIIDNSALRRGLETLHLIWARKYDDDFHLGESMGILSGNYALITVYRIFENLTDVSMETKLSLYTLLNQVIQDTLAGQILDVIVSNKSLDDANEEEILEIMRLKTAKYTILAPLQFGAILAGIPLKQLNALDNFSIPFGLAFQISDDILGTFGKEIKTGKSTNSDLMEGKKTLFILNAYEKCNLEEKQIFLNVLGKNNKTDKEYDKIREIIQKYKSLEYSQSKIEEYVQLGKKSLALFQGNESAKNILLSLAEQQISRSS
ncbi:MAG: polyprenyl synthetase family protein, partial [Candidatus Thorarchaeota archaeon]